MTTSRHILGALEIMNLPFFSMVIYDSTAKTKFLHEMTASRHILGDLEIVNLPFFSRVIYCYFSFIIELIIAFTVSVVTSAWIICAGAIK